MSFFARVIFGALLVIVGGCEIIDDTGNPIYPPTEPPIAYDYCADWSPDGSRIIFNRLNNVVTDIKGGLFFYDFEDSSLTHFLDGQFFDYPRFSPDGQWLVYGLGRNIYRIKVNGDSLQQLTFSGNDFDPCWSPDGKKIVYADVSGDNRGIHILDLETMESKFILPYSRMPVWLPDGERMVILSYNFQSNDELAIIDTSGHIITRLTDDDYFKSDPNVSDDGQYICFIQSWDLWIMNIDGTGAHMVTKGPAEYPAFSPDGQWIVYSNLQNYDGSLWLIRPDGTGKRRLTNYGHDY